MKHFRKVRFPGNALPSNHFEGEVAFFKAKQWDQRNRADLIESVTPFHDPQRWIKVDPQRWIKAGSFQLSWNEICCNQPAVL